MSSRRPPQTIEMKFIPHYGEVGAGRAVDNVIPFVPKSELCPVALPERYADRDLGMVTVRGLSLSQLGICDGDELVIKLRFRWRDISEDTICIVYIHATGELAAKRIIKNANTLTLRASGGGIKDAEYNPDEIEIRAIVLKVQTDVDAHIARFADHVRARSAMGG